MSSDQSKVHDEGTVDCLAVHEVADLGLNKFVENIAVRRSGQVLVTVHNTSELVEIDPHSDAPPKLINRFAENLFGIVEVEKDVFYISTGTIGQQGSFAIYRVEFSESAATHISKLVEVPDAMFLNGSCLLKPSGSIILVADSILGTVLAVDTKAKTVQTWLQHKALMKTTDTPGYPGVNGIKVHQNYLYLSNTEAKTFLRAEIAATGNATGTVETVYERCNIDDFAFDSEGSVYLTSHVFNSVVKITSNGARSRIAGGPSDRVVAGTTAVAFGRTSADKTRLYITTNGGMTYPIDGKIGSGRLLSIDTGHSADVN